MSRGLIAKTIKKLIGQRPKWGDWTSNISSGFVAPEDGVIRLDCTSGGGYNWFYTSVGRVCMQGGLSQWACFPIAKGEKFTINSYNDGNYVHAHYRPLKMGGGRNLCLFPAEGVAA